MNLATLKALVATGESQTLELKKSTAEKDRACRSLCVLDNGFIYRDYASAAGSVSVALYDDRLEAISPGELHFGRTPEALFRQHESKPWNPWIAKVFYRLWLLETWGRGTLKRLQQVPHVCISELAQHLGKSESAIDRVIRKFCEQGRLQRISPVKGGYWQVLLNE